MRLSGTLGKMLSMLFLLAATLAPAAEATPLYQQGVHVVEAGETLTAIAERYGISVEAILEANDIVNPSLIRIGQPLVIPSGSEVEVLAIPPDPPQNTGEAPQPKPASDTYIVQPGDTLTQIAREHNTTVAVLATINGIADASLLRAGQELVLSDDSVPPPAQWVPQGQLSMTVSISRQRCWVYQGNTLLYNWPCSTARSGSVTKTGTFYVQSKIREAWGSTWGFWMPHWLGIYWAGSSENGIHGLPYRPGGYPIWANAVGAPITYGCVLLGAQEARTLWEMAYIGMPVTIQQ